MASSDRYHSNGDRARIPGTVYLRDMFKHVLSGRQQPGHLRGWPSKALTEAMHPAHDVLCSASFARCSFFTTISVKGGHFPTGRGRGFLFFAHGGDLCGSKISKRRHNKKTNERASERTNATNETESERMEEQANERTGKRTDGRHGVQTSWLTAV